MQIAVTFTLVFLAAFGSASARAFGGDQFVSPQAKQMYQQWEHAAVHTSRNLMTEALTPTGSKHSQCPSTRTWLYEDSVCQPEGGKNVSMAMSPNTCVSVKDLNLDWGVSAYKYGFPPQPESLQFFPTPDCSGVHKSVGLEGLKGMQDVCPGTKGNNPVAGWNSGSFQMLLPEITNHFDFNKKIESIWYSCPDSTTSTSSSA